MRNKVAAQSYLKVSHKPHVDERDEFEKSKFEKQNKLNSNNLDTNKLNINKNPSIYM
jgi:hypothetical protein